MADTPPLTQVQIIQSLGEALAWMEKEISWGVALPDIGHLTGRIGELYVAMIKRGQMALATNQHGYDVVSATAERISVKTVTTSTYVSFNMNTLSLVDRIIVLRLNNDSDTGLSIEEVLDAPTKEAQEQMRDSGTKLIYTIPGKKRDTRPPEELKVIDQATYKDLEIRKFENGAIRLAKDGLLLQVVVKAKLHPIARALGIDINNANGLSKNTQQLGADIIRAIRASAGTLG